MQLLDRKAELDSVAARPARAIGSVESVRTAGLDLGPEPRQNGLERVRDRELPRGPPIHLPDRRPPAGAHEMVRRGVLEQPGRVAKEKAEVQRHLQEADRGSIELGDKNQRLDIGDANVPVEARRRIRPRRSVHVRKQLDHHDLAVVAKPDPRLRNARPRPADLGRIHHVDVAACAPRTLDGRPQRRDQAVEALDEDEGFATPAHVEAVLADRAQVLFP